MSALDFTNLYHTIIGNLLKHRRARPDTCGLPQHCLTNKIVPRPNIKSKYCRQTLKLNLSLMHVHVIAMPNLTDRQVYVSKVLQRSGPPRPRNRPSITIDDREDIKPVVVKQSAERITSMDKYGDSDSSNDDTKVYKPNTSKAKSLVNLKVEHSSNEDDRYDDSSNSKSEFEQVMIDKLDFVSSYI